MYEKTKFNRSEWAKNRWAQARTQQDLYNEKYDGDINKKEFFKTENPLTSKLVKYEVTYSLDYTPENNSYEFFIPQETFTIYALESPESKEDFEERTKQQIASIFKGQSTDWVYNRLQVNAKQSGVVRGIESDKVGYSEPNWGEFKNKDTYTRDIDKVEVGKGSNRIKANKNKYNLDLWF